MVKDPEMFEEEETAGDEGAGDNEGAEGEEGGGGGDSSKTAMLKEASAEASELGIIVPEDVANANEWVEHFITAVKSHKQTKNMNETETPEPAPGAENGGAPQEEPQAVSMSIKQHQERIDLLEGFAADQVYSRMNQLVDDMIVKGQVPPVKGAGWKEVLGKKRLSLLPGKHDNEVANVLSQLDLAKELPEGTFWTAEEKSARLSRKGKEEQAPEHASFDKNGEPVQLSSEQVIKVLDEQFGAKK